MIGTVYILHLFLDCRTNLGFYLLWEAHVKYELCPWMEKKSAELHLALPNMNIFTYIYIYIRQQKLHHRILAEHAYHHNF